MLDLFKTQCVIINRNSVSAGWTKWKGNTYQWKYDAENVLSVRIRQINKVHLMGYKKALLIHKLFVFAVQWIPAIRNKAEIIFNSKNYLYFLLPRTLKYFLENCRFCRKSENDAYIMGWWVMLFASLLEWKLFPKVKAALLGNI